MAEQKKAIEPQDKTCLTFNCRYSGYVSLLSHESQDAYGEILIVDAFDMQPQSA